MSSSSTQSFALTQAFKLSAPIVSMASRGTWSQPTLYNPCNIPFISPPPPTAVTMRSGTVPSSWVLASVIKDECPSLKKEWSRNTS